MSHLALLITSFFIFVIFIVDFKEKSELSSALWIPLIWLMMCASRYPLAWLNPNSVSDAGGGSKANIIFISGLIFYGLYVLWNRKINWSQILRSNVLFFILLLYMALSIIWSDFMYISLKRSVRTIGDAVIVLIVLTENDPLEAIKRILRRFAYIIIPISILVINYFPKFGLMYHPTSGQYMAIGITSHKNTLGMVSCICALFFLWDIKNEWRQKKMFIDIILLLMALWLMVGVGSSRSATSIIIFLVGFCIFTGVSLFKSKPEYAGRYIVVTIFFILLWLPFVYNFLFKFTIDYTGRDETLSGRIFIWKEVLDLGSSHPIFGAGYGSFWVEDYSPYDYYMLPRVKQAHNGYLDVYSELGLVGLGLLVGVIFFIYKNIMENFKSNFEYAQLRITLMTMILIANITESSLIRGNAFYWFLFLIAAINIPMKSIADTTYHN